MIRVLVSNLRSVVGGLLFLGSFLAGPASATTLVTFDGTGYQDGSVEYTITGNTLTITLTNTASYANNANLAPPDALTGVIFTLPTGISLDAQTALVAPGSSIIQANTCDAGPSCVGETNVGGEFGYQTAPFASPGVPAGDYNAGIGSSGQVVGNGTQFGGPDLDKPVQMNGINFGIVGSNYANANPNNGLTKDPLIQSAVTFNLTILGGTLLESQITNWALVFGTAWGEGTITTGTITTGVADTAVPEPSSLFLLGGGLTTLAAGLRRRNRRGTANA